MIITRTAIDGPALIDLELRADDRGFFARTFDRAEFLNAGLDPAVEQCNASFNHAAGTLRGMHYQLAHAPEVKLVRCVRGAIVDQIVDMRPGSATYLQHVSVELTAQNRRALYVPPMFAHGYQTLADETEVIYQVSGAYSPGAERGLRHSDPALGLSWPLPVSRISSKDAGWPLLELDPPEPDRLEPDRAGLDGLESDHVELGHLELDESALDLTTLRHRIWDGVIR